MRRKVKLSAKVFTLLHNEMLQKFKLDCQQKGFEVSENKAQLYGFGKAYDETLPNFQTHIVNDRGFRLFCEENNITVHKNIGKYLYQRSLDVQNGKAEVVLSGIIYATGFFRYLGYENATNYLNRNQELQKDEYTATLKKTKRSY